MDIVVTQIKQIGREIMLDGNSLVGYQHSANLFIKLIKETSETNPFKGMVLSGFCSSWKSDMPIVCPLQEKDDGTTFCCLMGCLKTKAMYICLWQRLTKIKSLSHLTD